MLTQLTTEMKRAREHGFHQQELEDAIKTIQAQAERAVTTEPTRKSKNIISELNNYISLERMPMSPKQELALVNDLITGISLADINESFDKTYSAFNRLIILEIPDKSGLEIPLKEDLLRTVRRAESLKVKPLDFKARPRQLLNKEPKGGNIASSKFHKLTQVTSVKLENGCCFHHKYSAMNKDNISVQLKFAGGRIEETEENQGITNMAILPLQQPAAARLTAIDIESLLTGKNVRVSGFADDDSLNITINSSRKDLEEGLRLAYLLINEAKVENAVFNLVHDKMLQEIEKRSSSVDMQLLDNLRRVATDNDPRFIMPTKKSINNLTIKDAQIWLKRILGNAPVEASIVGDIKVDEAKELMTKYLGSLPQRSSFEHLKNLRQIKIERMAQDKDIKVATKTPKSLVLVAWRGPDYHQTKDRHCMEMAAQILSSRLHKEIREERQLTYSAHCFSQAKQGFTNRGMLMSYFTTKKETARDAANLCKKVMMEFALNGPTQTELDTVRKQFKTNITTLMEKPSFWTSWLTDLNFHNKSLDDAPKLLETFMSYTAKDIHETVKTYFKEANSIVLVAVPE